MACDGTVETVTAKVTFFVDVETTGIQRFGPVSTQTAVENLLYVLAARSDVKKATVIRVVEVIA